MSELHDIDQPCTLSNQFEQNNLNAKWFKKLALPSLIYAVLYTVFTYDNEFGIGILAWIAVTLAYAVYLLRTSDIQLKRGSIFYLVIMGLLGT